MSKFCYVISCVCIVLCACSNISTQGTVYREEKLLMQYLDKYQFDTMPQHEFLLFTFRTQQLCRTCRAVPLDTVLKMAIESRQDEPMYVLTDNVTDMQHIKAEYGTDVICLIGNADIMDQYGIPALEPLLFKINNKKVVEVSNFYE